MPACPPFQLQPFTFSLHRRTPWHSFHLGQVLDHAAEHGYGVPAFNVNNLEQIQAFMEAARETDSPVILQASAGARKYRHPAGHERCDAQGVR